MIERAGLEEPNLFGEIKPWVYTYPNFPRPVDLLDSSGEKDVFGALGSN